jgi:hypothetical protein
MLQYWQNSLLRDLPKVCRKSQNHRASDGLEGSQLADLRAVPYLKQHDWPGPDEPGEPEAAKDSDDGEVGEPHKLQREGENDDEVHPVPDLRRAGGREQGITE